MYKLVTGFAGFYAMTKPRLDSEMRKKGQAGFTVFLEPWTLANLVHSRWSLEATDQRDSFAKVAQRSRICLPVQERRFQPRVRKAHCTRARHRSA